MRIALAQLNPTVGDIPGNAQLIENAIDQAREAGADLVITPELAIVGYPPRDLLLKPAVIEQSTQAIARLAARCTDIAAIIGYPTPSDSHDRGRALYNAAAFCQHGRIVTRRVKNLLPTYDVFDEQRYFEPGQRVDLTPLEHDGQTIPLGISICEDLWNDRESFSRQLYHDNPIDELARAGAKIFINCSASPFIVRKHAFRLKLMRHVARKYQLPLLYCNQVGGNDELVFDGNSCAFNADGELIAHAKSFAPDLLIVDLETPTVATPVTSVTSVASSTAIPAAEPVQPPALSDIETIYHALVLGLRDYCRKCGFNSVVLGLSGGIDSAVTAALCVAALGADNVRGVTMPSRYSSTGSVDDAIELAKRLGIRCDTVSIAEAHDSFESMLAPVFTGTEPGVAEENIQARIRGVIMMAMSNKFGAMLVTTGNKSELAVGYCTLYGDMCGGLAILSDVPKTMVWDLARWINTSDCELHRQFDGPVIPENSITKPPSAELRPDQVDQDSLPPYEQLDEIIERYVEREQSAQAIITETGFDAEMVYRIVRLIDINEYKRKQAAPGLKITGRAFGFGRRMPIAQRFDNRHESPGD